MGQAAGRSVRCAGAGFRPARVRGATRYAHLPLSPGRVGMDHPFHRADHRTGRDRTYGRWVFTRRRHDLPLRRYRRPGHIRRGLAAAGSRLPTVHAWRLQRRCAGAGQRGQPRKPGHPARMDPGTNPLSFCPRHRSSGFHPGALPVVRHHQSGLFRACPVPGYRRDLR